MNKKYISILLSIIFIWCNPLCAQTKKTIVGSKDIPLEMNLIIENLQKSDSANFEQILPIIKKIDLYARSMTKEDIFLIGKTEVYKTFLKNYDDPIKQPIDESAIAKINRAVEKNPSHFIKWFLQALIQDCQKILSHPLYKDFLSIKDRHVKIENLEYRKLEKKSELLQFWIAKIGLDDHDLTEASAFQKYFSEKMLEALKNIENSFALFVHEALPDNKSPLPPKPENELSFFSIKEINSTPAKPLKTEMKEKNIEEILSPVINGEKLQDLPTPSQENWLQEENSPSELKNLPKPTNDADWLEDF